MVAPGGGQTGSVWSPYVDLLHLVTDVVLDKNSARLAELESALRKHKPDFITLLKHPPSCAADRTRLQAATTADGIQLEDRAGKCVLAQEVVDEALLLSDLFNLNELVALQLLFAGESHMNMYTGLTRGLTAVLLYYDGRRSLVTAFKILVQARRGVTWNCELPDGVTDMITKYVDAILEDNMINKILELLARLNWADELERLNNASALANRRHLRQLQLLFEQTRQALADTAACWAAQTPLPQQHTLSLINHLATLEPAGASGQLDGVQLSLMMAVMFSISPLRMLRLVEAEDVVSQWCVLCEPGFAVTVNQLLVTPRRWTCRPLVAVLQLSWSCALLSLCNVAANITDPELAGVMEGDESMLDMAIKNDAFLHLREKVVAAKTFFDEEFYVRHVHEMVTTVPVVLPLKVKELRNYADETARTVQMHVQEGLEPPANLPQHFDHLLQLLAALYDQDRLQLGLAQEYWPLDNSSQRQMALFKFLRAAGDLLPSVLYVSYLTVLRALCQCRNGAQQCYALLTSASHSGLLSLAKLFAALHSYHASLSHHHHHQSPMLMTSSSGAFHSSSTVAAPRPPSKQLTTSELNVMIASLKLICAIAEGDAGCRLSMCERSAWSPLPLMLSLLRLHVPAPLKARLLLTLAAFARSPEVAGQLWRELEAAQLLQTQLPSAATSGQPRGIQMELEEVECRAEHFPQTRAFVALITTLAGGSVPRALGADTRTPGLAPYINFVVYDVLLNFNARAYRIAAEKYDVGAECVQFLLTLVESWDSTGVSKDQQPSTAATASVTATSSAAAAAAAASSRHPAESVLLLMMQETKLLRLLMYVLADCGRVLDLFSEFDGFDSLSRLCLLVLRFFNACLERQMAFLSLCRRRVDSAHSAALVSGLDVQLLGSQDFPLTVVKFLGYGSWLPEQTAEAAALLCRLCDKLPAQQQLCALFTGSADCLQQTRSAFVECLDTRVGEDDTIAGHRARVSVLRLLLSGLSLPGASVAHVLLGFSCSPVSATTRSRAGHQPTSDTLAPPVAAAAAAGAYHSSSPWSTGSLCFSLHQTAAPGRTCLHALLALLSDGLSAISPPTVCHTCPRTASMAYQVLYLLCASPLTSAETLRYLRSSCDFVYAQLQPLPRQPSGGATAACANHFMEHATWLMKIAAVEIKTTWCCQLSSHLTRLSTLLVDDQVPSAGAPVEGSFSLTQAIAASTTSINGSGGGSQQRKLIALLNAANFQMEPVARPDWHYFDLDQIEKTVSQCQAASGARLINVAQLHAILMAELAALQSTTALSQRQHIVHEIKSVLRHCVQRNEYSQWLQRTADYLLALRLLLELVVTVVPPEQLAQSADQLVLDITRHLLSKMVDPACVPELTAPLAGTLLLLMTWLANSCSSPAASSGSAGSSWTMAGQMALRGLLDSLQLRWTTALTSSAGGGGNSSSGCSRQRCRANLYGALLQLVQPVLAGERRQWRVQAAAVCAQYGRRLTDALCRDSSAGHHICRILAMCSLSALLVIDGSTVVDQLVSSGFVVSLSQLVAATAGGGGGAGGDDSSSSNNSSRQLQQQQQSGAQLHALFVYESQMALACRLAASGPGARELLRSGVLACLGRLAPWGQWGPMAAAAAPPAAGSEWSSQLLLMRLMCPALRLCLALVTTLSAADHSVVQQVLHFLSVKMEAVSVLLSYEPSSGDTDTLTVTCLLTGLLTHLTTHRGPLLTATATTAGGGAGASVKDANATAAAGQVVTRLRQLAVRQLSAFLACTATLADCHDTDQHRHDNLRLQVLCHLLEYYCCAVCDATVSVSAHSSAMFQQLVAALHTHAQLLDTVLERRVQLCDQLTRVDQLDSWQLSQLTPAGQLVNSPQQLQAAAATKLKQLLRLLDSKVWMVRFVLECSLLLAWRQLLALNSSAAASLSSPVSAAAAAGGGGGAQSHINSLRQQACSQLSDSLLNRLLHALKKSVAENEQNNFSEAMIRRIRRLTLLDCH